jgi:hypothetical protein
MSVRKKLNLRDVYSKQNMSLITKEYKLVTLHDINALNCNYW